MSNYSTKHAERVVGCPHARIVTPLGEASFDHGAQYFTARDAEFMRRIRLVRPRSRPQVACRRIGCMDRHAGNECPCSRHGRAPRHAFWPHGSRCCSRRSWLAACGEHIEPECFDAVLLAVPAEQAATLLGPIDLGMARQALVARSQPCWTGCSPSTTGYRPKTVTLRNHGLISWAARNSAKPGRDGPEAWVVQASGSWTSEHMGSEPARGRKADAGGFRRRPSARNR